VSIEEKNSNKKSTYKITIADIFDKERNDGEVRLYRDILKFFLPRIERLILCENKDDEEQEQLDFTFRIREMINWLLENNHELKIEFAGSKENKAHRASKINSRIKTRIEMLIELDLLTIYEEKVPSERNPNILTELYGISSNGILITLTSYFSKYIEGSKDHKKILKFLLKEWLSKLPMSIKIFLTIIILS